jgi:hypothetical protein
MKLKEGEEQKNTPSMVCIITNERVEICWGKLKWGKGKS